MTNIDELTIEQKVGQLFHVGFAGTEPSEPIEELIREYHIGGVIYFARNVSGPDQTRELTRSLQQTAVETDPQLPLFVSIDQEGGTVRRLPFYTQVPGQMAVGATKKPNAAATAASITADQLRSVGINFNLAPVLDVNSNPENPVIGVRSYGEEPETVGEFGAHYVKAAREAGLLTCGKHFPGHGDTETDSHAGLPVIDSETERVRRVELPPFARAIEVGIDAIMTAHVAFPAITGSKTRPATLSKSVLTGWLRDQLGFDGLVMTDCMEMDAIADTVGTEQGAVRAIRAGADGVLVSHSFDRQRRSIEAVVDAIADGEISEARLDDAVERVLALKRSRDLRPAGKIRPDAAANRKAVRSIGREAVTVVEDTADRLPLSVDEPLEVVAARPSAGSPAEGEHSYADDLGEALADCGFSPNVSEFVDELPIDPAMLPSGTQVLCCVADLARNPDQRAAIEELVDAGVDPVVVGVRNPYDIRSLPWINTYLTTYDPTRPNLAALAEVLAGDRPAHGRVPPSLR